MKFVGEELQKLATSEKDMKKKEYLVRSSFNRYYYASFLITRDLLNELDSSWKFTPHSEIPTLLTTAIQKKVNHFLRIQVRKNLYNETEKLKIENKIRTATRDLSNLLKLAYHVRVIADYQPEIEVLFGKNDVPSIENTTLATANKWVNKTQQCCIIIKKIYKDLAIV